MNSLARRLRRTTVLTLCALAALGLFAASALARNVYTVDYTSGTVTAIDTKTNQVVGTPLPVGPTSNPYSNAISPDGKAMLLINNGANTLVKVDLPSWTVGAPLPVGTDPTVVAISPDGSTAYVADGSGKAVHVVDLKTMQIVGSPIDLPGETWGVAFAPSGKIAYVTDETNNVVHVIDTQTRQIVGAPIPAGEEPINVAFTPDGKRALVTNGESDDVTVIDVTSGTKQTDIKVGEFPWEAAITPDGRRAFVTNYQEETVSVIDLQTNAVVGPAIKVGSEPYGVAITPNGRSAYVANYGDKSVSVIDTASNQVTPTIPLPGTGVWLLAIAPDQSPVPSFTAAAATAGKATKFDAAASQDPDGLISAFDWSFGDGASAASTGPKTSHKYKKAKKFTASLRVTDDEGCSTELVFTGRTAYCSGTAAATRTFKVKAPNTFGFGGLVKDTANGTAKLKVKLPYAGSVQLSGKGVRAAKRSAGKAKAVTLPIKPQASLRQRLLTAGSAKVKLKVKFKPQGGKARTKAKTVTLVLR